jgi:autotransporter translocation and assembly factor TamB
MVADARSPTPLEPPGGGPRRRRRTRWLAGAGLVLAGLAGLAALRERWAGPLVAHAARAWAREHLGAELELTRVSGAWWREVVLEGVRLTGGRAPLRAVAEARIELSFSLRGLLGGDAGLALRVRGRGIELESGPGKSAGGVGSRPVDLSLELHDLRIRTAGNEPLRLDRLALTGSLRGTEARLARVEVAAGSNLVTLSEAVLDLAASSGLELVRRARGACTAHLPEARRLGEPFGVPLRSAELELRAADGCAQVAGDLALDGGRLALARGELVLPANGLWSELLLDLDLTGEFEDVAPLARGLGQDVAGRWSGSIEVSGPLRAPSGRFVGHGEELRVRGVELDVLDVDVTTDGEVARFERCEIEGPALIAVLRGGLQLEPLAFEDLAFNVSADSGALRELLPFPCQHAFLHARLDGPVEVPSGSFEASAGGLEFERLRVDDAEARGRVENGRLEVAELHLTSGESTIEAAGTVQRAGRGIAASLAQLALLWRDTRVELERGAELAYAPGRLEVEGVALTSTSARGTGRAEIAFRHGEGGTRAAVTFADYDAGALLAPFLPAGSQAGRIHGTLQGSVGAAGGAELPVIALELALEGWRVGPAWPELAARLRGEFDGQRLDLEQLELTTTADEAPSVRGLLRVPFDPLQPAELLPGAVELRLDVATGDLVRSLARGGVELGPTRTGPCTLALELGGTWNALTGRLGLAAQAVTLGSEATSRAADLEAEVELGQRLRLLHATLSAPNGTMRVTGEVDSVLDVPRWLGDRWALLDAPLALDARLDLADIGWVAGLSQDLRRTAGQLAGRVRVGGTALAPTFDGTLELTDGELRLSGNATPIRDVQAALTLENDVVHIDSLRGEVGGAPVLVTGTLEPFGPFRRFDLAISGQDLLLARDARLRLRADAELSVRGTPSRLAIGGELELSEGRYTTEFSPLEELLRATRREEAERPAGFTLWPDGFLADATLDLHAVGPRAFEYRSNLLEASLRPDLLLRGTGAFPTLEGTLYAERASLELPSGTLKLTSGLLTFRPERSLEPELALSAEMRVQRHTVRAAITGTLREPEVVLSSSPPLAGDDLWVLALTGQLPVARGEDRSAAAMEALAVFLARDAVVRWFGGDPSDAEGLLERFEIDLGAKPSRSGQTTGRVVFYLKPESRRSGRATYLSAEVDEYDRVNFAFGLLFRPR